MMKPVIGLLALFVVACGGSGKSSPLPTEPTLPSNQVDGGQGGMRAGLIEANSELALAEVNGKLYLLGGYPSNRVTARTVQVPRGNDFAVYHPASDTWQVLPLLPTQRNHLTGAAINGRIHIAGGRQGDGLSPLMTTVHEVFDPQSGGWATAAPMLRPRSGMNGVMARGCFHVWGGEGPAGMFPDHDYYDPRTDKWTRLRDMPIPVHGVYGSAFVNGVIWASGGSTSIGGSFGSLYNQVFSPTVSCE
jgi:N-acetylneuraminic acid mutarotase